MISSFATFRGDGMAKRDRRHCYQPSGRPQLGSAAVRARARRRCSRRLLRARYAAVPAQATTATGGREGLMTEQACGNVRAHPRLRVRSSPLAGPPTPDRRLASIRPACAIEAAFTIFQDPMTLNIGGTGAIKPYAKYNSKADKWFARGETAIRDRPADLRRRLRQHPHRLAALPRGPGAGAGDRSLARPGRPSPGRGLQARLRARRVQPEVVRRPPSWPAPRSTSATPSARSTPPGWSSGPASGPAAGRGLHRGRADEGQVRHQLQAEAGAGPLGRPAGAAAGREPGRAARGLAGRRRQPPPRPRHRTSPPAAGRAAGRPCSRAEF